MRVRYSFKCSGFEYGGQYECKCYSCGDGAGGEYCEGRYMVSFPFRGKYHSVWRRILKARRVKGSPDCKYQNPVYGIA